jgi:hypothetical protein
MAPDSCTVVSQHLDLAQEGEVIRVMRLETWRALQRQADRAQAVELQRDPRGGFAS